MTTGRITAVLHPREGGARESVMHFELDRRLPPAALEELADAVRSVLGDVRRAVLDFPAMADRARRMIHLAAAGASRYADDEVDETVAFLEWLLRDNFVFLGYREYRILDEAIAVVPGSGLGILADEASSAFARPRRLAELPRELCERALEGDLLLVTKTNAIATVHRRDRMDYIGVRKVAPDGRIVGEARMLGHFTSKAYAEPASTTPLLHRKLRQILRTEDLIEGSHDYKTAVEVFNSFPKDELFAAPTTDLRRAVAAMLALEGDRVRLLGRRSADGRSASLIVALPADRYDAELLDALTALVRRRFHTEAVTTHTVLGQEDWVRVHVSVHAADGIPDVPAPELEQEVVSLTRTWDDGLRERLVDAVGPTRGRELAGGGDRASRSTTARPSSRPSRSPTSRAWTGSSRSGCHSWSASRTSPAARGSRCTSRAARSSWPRRCRRSSTSACASSRRFRPACAAATATRGCRTSASSAPATARSTSRRSGDRIADCIAAVRRGDAESDSLNRLVVVAGLNWRQVSVLRAYRMYRQRIGSRFTQGYQNDVLAANPALTAKLMAYFELRFDPRGDGGEERETALREEILGDLEAVESLDHDRILRNQLKLIDATLRTNAFCDGRSVTAFKLRSAEVPAIPQPTPLFEIYVYSPAMEGIHLRGGRVARGGIRWSDRQDYRTEVLGLMRAQMTKNAVIVPAGAKGGFYLKTPPADPDERRLEVERQYVRYIEGLLQLTDDLVDGRVVHPGGVRVRDEADTYLVVAADKGTAALSDTANRVSEERGFWLGDAFASGGSTGYDHKALGITARGAWESVKRHFRQLGPRPRHGPVHRGRHRRHVGRRVRQRDAALGPDPARRRLRPPPRRHRPRPGPRRRLRGATAAVRAPRLDLGDYDRGAISAGGGVWPRSAKSISLSAEAQAALGVEADRLQPNEVIRAILRAPVDLLWNGGIGTVVKAAAETDADAMDRASDAIRVDARDLRCRVVGEGGNLGFTRRARVEYARGGGLIFADFIDNSGGVDCSDHEVNLKILLGLAERRGRLTRPERDELLRAVTTDVVGHVLYDSFLQSQILAEEVAVSRGRLYAYEDLMTALEADGLLDRELEALPGAEEMAERRRGGAGHGTPELAILLAYAKRALARSLLASEFCDDPWLERDLREYFPPAVVERFGDLLPEHPLRRELIAMTNANHVVNSLGPTFVSQLAAERGAEPAEVVRAFRVAREITGAVPRWDAVERLPRSIDQTTATELMEGVDRLAEAATRWYVSHDRAHDLEGAIARAEAPFARLVAVLPDIGGDAWRERRGEVAAGLIATGVPEDVAWAHALTPELQQAPDIIAIAEDTGRPVESVTAAVHDLGARLEIVWLLAALDHLPQPTRTQRWAARPCARTAWRRWRSSPAPRSRAPTRRCRPPRPWTPTSPRADAGAPPRARHALAHRRGHERPAGAHARRPRAPRTGRLMAGLVLGPLLRYAGETEATIWVETDAPCEVEAAGARQRTFAVEGHHYALVHCTGLERPRRSSTRCGWTASGSGPRRTPRSRPAHPHPGGRRAVPHRMGLMPRVRPARSAVLPAQGRRSARPRGRRAARARRPHGPQRAGGLAARARPPRRPGVRGRGAARPARVHPLAPRSRGPAGRHDRRLRGVHAPVSRVVVGAPHPLAVLHRAHGDGLRRPRRARRLEHLARLGPRHARHGLVGRPHRGRLHVLLALPAPGEPRAGALVEDSLYARVREADDAGPILREFAFLADREVAGTRWSYCRTSGARG
jgi:glutamate dehydrogenase